MEETVHDNFFKNFTVVTATISAADYLPETSGIYAFYHAFDFLENKLSDHIDTRIKNTVFKTKFSETDNRSKFIVDTCGESVGLSPKMDQFIRAVSQPKERRILKNLLISCSILQCPDYIGTANNLRDRFIQHLERDDGFFSKYANLRSNDELLFVCLPCPKNISRELESLLIQLCQPKFNTQRSYKMELDNQSPETIEYKAISGKFGEVRYFITTLDQSDAVENIRFADEIQGSWSFSERVQRKLDKKRADTDIFSYLAQGGIRFFNSIVVVLLPNSNDQREFWDFSPVTSHGKTVEKWVNLKLYKNVARIVIDGQHRLLSLKKYWNVHTGKDPLTPQQENEHFDCSQRFDIPVVYLVFGDLGRVGHADLSETVREEIIKATRNIFTVINKTAKSIDKQTQLLLDDSKISALIARKLLEGGVLEERFVKWSSKAGGLNQSEPYLTTLDLVSQCTIELLKDYPKQALKKSFNSPIERNIALETYYDSRPKLPEIGTKELLKWFFTELQPFKDWVSQISYVGIDIPIQPEQSRLSTSQKASIKKFRDSSILYTLLGQKILFFAVSRFLLKIRIEYRIPAILNAISLSITKMDKDGFFSRDKSH